MLGHCTGCPQMLAIPGALSSGKGTNPWQSAELTVGVTQEPDWHQVPPFATPQHVRSCPGSATH